MNFDVMTSTLKERFSNPIRLATILGLFLFPIPIALVDPRPNSSAFFHPLIAVAIASGILGLDFSTGVLALVFTRPIRRSTYALSKWAAVTLTAIALSSVQLIAVDAILRVRHDAGIPDLLSARLAERVVAAAGTSAVVLLLSALGSGLSDLAVWGLACIAAQTCRMVGLVNHDDFWLRFGEGLLFLLAPGYGSGLAASLLNFPALALAVFLTIAALGLSVWVLERREITYSEIRA